MKLNVSPMNPHSLMEGCCFGTESFTNRLARTGSRDEFSPITGTATLPVAQGFAFRVLMASNASF